MCVSDRGVRHVNKKRVAGMHSRCQITVTTNYSPLIAHGPIFTVEVSSCIIHCLSPVVGVHVNVNSKVLCSNTDGNLTFKHTVCS